MNNIFIKSMSSSKLFCHIISINNENFRGKEIMGKISRDSNR